MNFSSLGHKFKLKFEILQSFKLQSFKLVRFYCTCNDPSIYHRLHEPLSCKVHLITQCPHDAPEFELQLPIHN
jgi:hypothetical protein